MNLIFTPEMYLSFDGVFSSGWSHPIFSWYDKFLKMTVSKLSYYRWVTTRALRIIPIQRIRIFFSKTINRDLEELTMPSSVPDENVFGGFWRRSRHLDYDLYFAKA
jgi:hypothetical protein